MYGHSAAAHPASPDTSRPREDDPAEVEWLIAERVHLTVVPLSTVELRVFDTVAAHNLKRLLDLGVCVTANSDDPAYFGGYLEENFRAAQAALHPSRGDVTAACTPPFAGRFSPRESAGVWPRRGRPMWKAGVSRFPF